MDRRFVVGGGKRACVVGVVGCGVVEDGKGVLIWICCQGLVVVVVVISTGMEPSSSTQHTIARRGQWFLDCCSLFSFHSLIPWPFFCRMGRGGQVHGRFG